jgi:hexosaminidase
MKRTRDCIKKETPMNRRNHNTAALAAVLLLSAFSARSVNAASPPALIPAPQKLVMRDGSFELTRPVTIVAETDAEREAGTLAEELHSLLNSDPIAVAKPTEPGAIRLEIDPSLAAALGREGYRLTVTAGGVQIRAADEAGLFYGGTTLCQLLDTNGDSPSHPAATPATPLSIPCLEIEDAPRFAWRGLLLDPARHFLPVEFVKKFIRTMSLYKFNSLQLHLTDDQGWRLQIKKYPELTQIGSVRRESPKKGDRTQGDGTPHGPYFYTQEEIRDLVAFAAKRHVDLLPEIEMPGHFLAALSAYPQFSCRGVPIQVRTRWGIEPDILCAGNDDAIEFVKDILAEVCDLFPGRFVHIGGDEAPRDRWKECPRCQARIRSQGLKNEAQLQTWMNQQVEKFLEGRGRRMIGWDEILEGGLTPRAAVMSWRGMDGGKAAAQAGHDVVMSPTSHCYFDYAQARGPDEPEAIGGFVPLEAVYSFEPVPPSLPDSQRKHILGAQANLWGEYFWSGSDVEYFAFPRAIALSEVVWSPADRRDFSEFRSRLQRHALTLQRLGVRFRPID